MGYRICSLNRVKIEIDDAVKESIWFDFAGAISRMLSILPDDHLLSLDKIQVVENSPFKNQKKVNGLYCGKNEGYIKPKVIICTRNLFMGIPNIVIKLVPFFPTILLSDTLYHEIGHHVQRFHYGVKKEQWEKDAALYSKRMRFKYFTSFGLLKFIYKFRIILRPIIIILLLIVNKLRGYENKVSKGGK